MSAAAAATAEKFKNVGAPKCQACEKTVYKAEELYAMDVQWHSGCFTCGLSTDTGCRRQLALGGFHAVSRVPYCDGCFNRVTRDAQSKSTLSVAVTRDEQAKSDKSNGSDKKSSPPKAASQYVYSEFKADNSARQEALKARFAPASAANKCPVCSKGVYLNEQVLAANKTWHPACFTCGGDGAIGCHKKLKIDEYVAHQGLPYCKMCGDKILQEANAKSVAGATDRPPASPQKQQQQQLAGSSDSGKFKHLGSQSNPDKCSACSTTVYKAEQILVANKFYHPRCLSCGGAASNGCKRRLALVDFQGKPISF